MRECANSKNVIRLPLTRKPRAVIYKLLNYLSELSSQSSSPRTFRIA